MLVAATARLIGMLPNTFTRTHHPIIEAYDPPEGWGWCYVDQIVLDLGRRTTPHNGPIPRYY